MYVTFSKTPCSNVTVCVTNTYLNVRNIIYAPVNSRMRVDESVVTGESDLFAVCRELSSANWDQLSSCLEDVTDSRCLLIQLLIIIIMRRVSLL